MGMIGTRQMGMEKLLSHCLNSRGSKAFGLNMLIRVDMHRTIAMPITTNEILLDQVANVSYHKLDGVSIKAA